MSQDGLRGFLGRISKKLIRMSVGSGARERELKCRLDETPGVRGDARVPESSFEAYPDLKGLVKLLPAPLIPAQKPS